jgi:hypothetical protein
VRPNHKQNWINNFERTDNRLPKHAVNYKPRGRTDRGRPSKRGQRVDAGTGQTTQCTEDDDADKKKSRYMESFGAYSNFNNLRYN